MVIDGKPYRIFSWRISHGGKGRPKDEYRVQTTRPGEMPFAGRGPGTLLLGWYEELDVFAAWDVRMHPRPKKSDSLQVRLPVLEAAASEGLVARTRAVSAGTEVVVVFRPEAMTTYLEMAELLPGTRASKKDVEATARAASGESVPVAELPKNAGRRRQIREIREKVRDQRFRTRVIDAYGGHCAFCGLGGGLAQAAHIAGVGEGGPDLVVNGVGACPNHHAAFDRGLITVGPGYKIEVNRRRLREHGCAPSEVRDFAAVVFDSLMLPVAVENHPDPGRFAVHRRRWR